MTRDPRGRPSGSLRRLLPALALGLLTAAGAGLFLLSLRAGRVEPTLQVEFAAGPPPGVVVLEAANDPGPDPFTDPVVVAVRLDPALLPLPPGDPAPVALPHRRHSAADLGAAGPFGFELVQRRDRGQRLTVSLIAALAQQVLGAPAILGDLVDGGGGGRDDDGRFTLTVADGSAACLTLSEPRRLALAQGLQADPGDGVPASDFTRDPGGLCLPPLRRPRPAPHGSAPGVDAAATAGEVGDVPLLLERLVANPPVAQAWALVHGLDLTALTGFGAGMTPVILLQDILVTDHGYESGRILLRRAVEQQGTAVLADARGVAVEG